jgi:hypothetical protein
MFNRILELSRWEKVIDVEQGRRMAEAEIVVRYPLQWVEEYIRNDFPAVWLSDFPDLFVKSRGVYKSDRLARTGVYSLR